MELEVPIDGLEAVKDYIPSLVVGDPGNSAVRAIQVRDSFEISSIVITPDSQTPSS